MCACRGVRPEWDGAGLSEKQVVAPSALSARNHRRGTCVGVQSGSAAAGEDPETSELMDGPHTGQNPGMRWCQVLGRKRGTSKRESFMKELVTKVCRDKRVSKGWVTGSEPLGQSQQECRGLMGTQGDPQRRRSREPREPRRRPGSCGEVWTEDPRGTGSEEAGRR